MSQNSERIRIWQRQYQKICADVTPAYLIKNSPIILYFVIWNIIYGNLKYHWWWQQSDPAVSRGVLPGGSRTRYYPIHDNILVDERRLGQLTLQLVGLGTEDMLFNIADSGVRAMARMNLDNKFLL